MTKQYVLPETIKSRVMNPLKSANTWWLLLTLPSWVAIGTVQAWWIVAIINIVTIVIGCFATDSVIAAAKRNPKVLNKNKIEIITDESNPSIMSLVSNCASRVLAPIPVVGISNSTVFDNLDITTTFGWDKGNGLLLIPIKLIPIISYQEFTGLLLQELALFRITSIDLVATISLLPWVADLLVAINYHSHVIDWFSWAQMMLIFLGIYALQQIAFAVVGFVDELRADSIAGQSGAAYVLTRGILAVSDHIYSQPGRISVGWLYTLITRHPPSAYRIRRLLRQFPEQFTPDEMASIAIQVDAPVPPSHQRDHTSQEVTSTRQIS